MMNCAESGFEGADQSITKFSGVSIHSSAKPPSVPRNNSKKISKENQNFAALHNSTGMINTEVKFQMDLASPLEQNQPRESIGIKQNKANSNKNSQLHLQRPFRPQKVPSLHQTRQNSLQKEVQLIRHSSAKRSNNKQIFPFGSEKCTLMSAEHVFNESFAQSQTITESVTIDVKGANSNKNADQRGQKRKKKSQRAQTFMPSANERNQNPLGLPVTMAERASVQAQAKNLAQAYLPSLIPGQNNKMQQMPRSKSRSPPPPDLPSGQVKRNKGPKPKTELEKAKKLQQSYRKLQIIDGPSNYAVEAAYKDNLSPLYRHTRQPNEGNEEQKKTTRMSGGGSLKSQSSATAAARQDFVFPAGVVHSTSNLKKKNSQCNAKLPPILPQPNATSSLHNFDQDVPAPQKSPNSSPVKRPDPFPECDDSNINANGSQLGCSDFSMKVDQQAIVIDQGQDDNNKQNCKSSKGMNQRNGDQKQVIGREPKNMPPPKPYSTGPPKGGPIKFASPASPRTLQDEYPEQEERKVDFEQKNLDKLRVMQEKRAAELKMIEDERAKAERRHKKLQALILKEAAERKAKKAALLEQAEKELDQDEQQYLNLKDVKKQVKNLNNVQGQENEEQKTEEELAIDAEEKKKRDIMRKFYRNRYSSFLHTLTKKRGVVEEELKEAKEAEDKKKAKIRQKVVGDTGAIKARFMEAKPLIPTAEELADIEREQQRRPQHTTQQVLVVGNQSTVLSNVTNGNKRGRTDSTTLASSVANTQEFTAQSAATTQGGVMHKRQLRSSRSNRRSMSNTSMGQMNSIGKIYQNGTKGKRTSSRSSNRSKGDVQLPPLSVKKQSSSSNKLPMLQRNRTLTPQSKIAREHKQEVMMLSAEDQAAFDEKNEQEELAKAEEKRKRAIGIRDRNAKMMKAIQEKKDAEKEKREAIENKKEKAKMKARAEVLNHYEELQNQPGLREQQDSRLQSKRPKESSPQPTGKVIKYPPVKEMKPYDEQAIQNFCDRLVPQNQIFLKITDMVAWKKKYRVDEDTKVFIIRGGYPDIKKALKARDWVENKDNDSPCFDFKWTLKPSDIDRKTLTADQMVNHFPKATSVTTKVGLTHSLRNLIWFNNIDIDTFFPRCFDCGIQEELDDFIQEFKAVKACSFLKIYIREMRECYECLVQDGNENSGMINAPSISKQILKISTDVCQKRTRDLNDLIDDPNAFDQVVTDAEWNILAANEMNYDELQTRKHEQWLKKHDLTMKARKDKKRKKKAKKVQYEPAQMQAGFAGGRDIQKRENNNENGEGGENDDEYGYEDNEYDAEEAEQRKQEDFLDNQIAKHIPQYGMTVALLKKLVEMNPQFELDGERNVWIVKPAGSSRGRGIVLYKNLVEILDLCTNKSNKTCDLLQWIVQKYIENPLIVMNRKFDLRQWVLITDWNPLTVWMYAEPYIRFPASDFTFENITNRYAHLSNNSVCKNANKVQTTYEIDGNMWNLSDLQDYLSEEYGYDVWEDVIVEKIKNVVINTMESVQDMFECKKGQFELFGFDIMLDQDFNAWLIEVNSSPAMDYSTAVTERLVKMVLEDTVKVVVDYNGCTNPKKRAKIDTGLYECIYRAKRVVDKPMGSFGLNLEVKGKKVPEHHLHKY